MPNVPQITPTYVRARLAVDPATGVLTWRYHDSMPASWNARWAGKPAFTAQDQGYRVGGICGRRFLAHRVVWALVYGEWPEGEIDHIDGDRSNNRISNLRVVNTAENLRNRCVSSNNTSGRMGVYWHTRSRKWVAFVYVNKRKVYLGGFSTLDAAAASRAAAEREHGYHENHGRPAK